MTLHVLFIIFIHLCTLDQKSHTFRVAAAFDQFLIIQNTLLYFLIPAGTAQKLTLKVPLLVVFLFFSIHFFFKVVSMESTYFALWVGSRNIHTSPTDGLFSKTPSGILMNTQSIHLFC